MYTCAPSVWIWMLVFSVFFPASLLQRGMLLARPHHMTFVPLINWLTLPQFDIFEMRQWAVDQGWSRAKALSSLRCAPGWAVWASQALMQSVFRWKELDRIYDFHWMRPERLLLSCERRWDSWPPEEKNSVWGQWRGLISQSFCVIKFY